MTVLGIRDYAKDIALFEPYIPQEPYKTAAEASEAVDLLLESLKPIVRKLSSFGTGSYEDRRRLLHAALNVLEPGYLNKKCRLKLNSLLQTELRERSIMRDTDLAGSDGFKVCGTSVTVWQDDITMLRIDAIVNAANNRLLGCFQPLHNCIDNVIHSRAGVELRDDCFTIMQKQKCTEPTGIAKVTRAYNLPSRFVIHTVGPIVQENLNPLHQEQLARAYFSCLEICKSMSEIRSIAFCSISTGVFGYPFQPAAQTALKTVIDWLKMNPDSLDHVIFDVFSGEHKHIYETLIGEQ